MKSGIPMEPRHRVGDRKGGNWHDAFREAYSGQARGGHQTEGHYINGKRDGRWDTIYGDGGARVFHYDENKLHGLEVHVSPSGERWEGEWRNGKRFQGRWVWLRADGAVAISASFVGAQVTELETSGMHLAEGTPPAPGRAPINGAFGISFGPAGMGQLMTLNCLEPLNASWMMHSWTDEQEAVRCATALLEDDSWTTFSLPLEVKQPPRPIAGGQRYYVRPSLEMGITEISTIFGQFDSWEACLEEQARISEMLVRKYGPCKIFVNENWHNVVGQCDAKGLAERRVKTDCKSGDGRYAASLAYEIVTEDERRATTRAWLRDGNPSVDEL